MFKKKKLEKNTCFVVSLFRCLVMSLHERRDEIAFKFLKMHEIVDVNKTKLLPKKFACPYNFRRTRTFANPTTSTKRTQLNLINFNASISNTM